MTWLYAPDTWTGFLSAEDAAWQAWEIWGDGMRLHPMSDGGLGCGEVLCGALGTRPLQVPGRGADGGPADTRIYPLKGALFVESAHSVGLHTCPPSPMQATSEGLGALLRRLADRSDSPLIVGLGGSGTMDGGLGLAQGLGLVPCDASGQALPPGAGAEALGRVAALHGPPPLRDRLIRVWADVRTPLLDSARVFGPQKGASPEQIREVTAGLERWARVLNAWRGHHGRPPLPLQLTHGGAAGGLGFALRTLLEAPLLPGAEAVARVTGLDAALQGVDGVLLGEGRLDPSSLDGKVVGEVLRRARAAGVPQVHVICGSQRGPLPPPPEGPDRVLCCDDMPGADRLARYRAGLAALAERAGVG